MAPLIQEVSGASNTKVRIQAVQALLEVPSDVSYWQPAEADALVIAVCDALQSIKDGVSPSTCSSAAESRQLAAYVQTLRSELLKLAEHWATHALSLPGAGARA